MRVKGISEQAWQGHGSQRRLLCELEQHCTANQFFRRVLECPAFEMTAALGEGKALLIGKGAVPHQRVVHWALDVVQNNLVRAAIERAPLFIKDGEIHALGEPGFGQTVVVDAEHQIVFVFEAGLHYIRLVTARNAHDPFYARKGAYILKVWPSSSLVTRKGIAKVVRNT